ncbi:MAG TPA: YqcC family protein, partial [Kofleriaceae bacterium]|nr:YqcC family protein [Kofleriaceae bacterium]
MIDPGDLRTRLAAVIAAMKRSGAWEVARPADDAIADLGAFGGRTMAFEQWLRWVFVPRVEALIASEGPWPPTSQVAARAVREADTSPALAGVVDALAAFDAAFDGDAGRENQAGWALISRP